ncbi:hypothetical protein SAMN04488515_3293 [Cognatiyoonia koreensis]|uniref:Uncharacterized protein n=1 Tax=Cognatiyoonia koreensis TaxID=364200 RepID=A0A1I0RUN5_9RHOB|nr:hypothetical protein [Cognatiyoonia koreensis]SEW45157.1 hypothetical protein SAMN04488515_3293 [Cognatiyoonia koreensis]
MRGFLACLIGLIANPVFACAELVQSCTFNGGKKEMVVCLEGSDVTYRFGPSGGTPELALRVPITDADYTPWPGVGRAIWEGMVFYNGDYSYEVSAAFERMFNDSDEPEPTRGGILIMQGETVVAELTCDVGSVDWAYGDGGLWAAKTRAGQCWKDFSWVACN